MAMISGQEQSVDELVEAVYFPKMPADFEDRELNVALQRVKVPLMAELITIQKAGDTAKLNKGQSHAMGDLYSRHLR